MNILDVCVFLLWIVNYNGKLVVWIPGISLWKGLLLKGTVPLQSQATNLSLAEIVP